MGSCPLSVCIRGSDAGKVPAASLENPAPEPSKAPEGTVPSLSVQRPCQKDTHGCAAGVNHHIPHTGTSPRGEKLVQFIGCGVAGTDCDGSKDELRPCQAADVEGKTQERAKEEILREMCCLPNPELPDVFIVQDLGPCPSRLKGIVCSLYQCCCHLFRETAGLPRVLGGESKDQGTHAGSGEKGEIHEVQREE